MYRLGDTRTGGCCCRRRAASWTRRTGTTRSVLPRPARGCRAHTAHHQRVHTTCTCITEAPIPTCNLSSCRATEALGSWGRTDACSACHYTSRSSSPPPICLPLPLIRACMRTNAARAQQLEHPIHAINSNGASSAKRETCGVRGSMASFSLPSHSPLVSVPPRRTLSLRSTPSRQQQQAIKTQPGAKTAHTHTHTHTHTHILYIHTYIHTLTLRARAGTGSVGRGAQGQ